MIGNDTPWFVKARRDYVTIPTACKNLDDVRGITVAKRRMVIGNPRTLAGNSLRRLWALWPLWYHALVCAVSFL